MLQIYFSSLLCIVKTKKSSFCTLKMTLPISQYPLDLSSLIIRHSNNDKCYGYHYSVLSNA